MKKSLVLAMAMALGVTASAYAANPFSDVPAGHWAYDNISKLAATGVIDGYGDTTFGGDKLMTRYEMAQIIAKAMAKGASVDKLAAEFVDELDTLGVRVANLEKKTDAVKITGEVRFRYLDQSNGYRLDCYNYDANGEGTNHRADIRSRIWVNGTINDDWTYTGMFENTQNLADNKGNEDTSFQRAYVDGKIGGVKVRAGRYNAVIADGNVYDTRVDGIEASYGKDVKVRAFVGKATDGEEMLGDKFTYGKYWGAEVAGEISKWDLLAGYAKFVDIITFEGDSDSGNDDGIFYVGAGYNFDKNFSMNAMYLKANTNDEYTMSSDYKDGDKGYVIGLKYKGAEAARPGSWGLWANYYDQGYATYMVHTTDANAFNYVGFDLEGFKGYGVGANYAVAKNIVATVAYYDTESKYCWDEKVEDKRLWTDVTFTF